MVPISALFSGTLWLGNAAYLYLSVAFIQMLKVRTLQWLLKQTSMQPTAPGTATCPPAIAICHCYQAA